MLLIAYPSLQRKTGRNQDPPVGKILGLQISDCKNVHYMHNHNVIMLAYQETSEITLPFCWCRKDWGNVTCNHIRILAPFPNLKVLKLFQYKTMTPNNSELIKNAEHQILRCRSVLFQSIYNRIKSLLQNVFLTTSRGSSMIKTVYLKWSFNEAYFSHCLLKELWEKK